MAGCGTDVRRMVPEEGVEPTRPCGHRILSPARLPVPPLRVGHSKITCRRPALKDASHYGTDSFPGNQTCLALRPSHRNWRFWFRADVSLEVDRSACIPVLAGRITLMRCPHDPYILVLSKSAYVASALKATLIELLASHSNRSNLFENLRHPLRRHQCGLLLLTNEHLRWRYQCLADKMVRSVLHCETYAWTDSIAL
jgi:hypothetical protein